MGKLCSQLNGSGKQLETAKLGYAAHPATHRFDERIRRGRPDAAAPPTRISTSIGSSSTSSSPTSAAMPSRSPRRYARMMAKARLRRSSAMATYPTPAKC